MAGDDKSAWAAIIRSVDTPLGFFALAMLVFGGAVIGLVAGGVHGHTLYATLLLFALMWLSIVLLTVRYPTHLGKRIAQIEDLLQSQALDDKIGDVINSKVKKDALN